MWKLIVDIATVGAFIVALLVFFGLQDRTKIAFQAALRPSFLWLLFVLFSLTLTVVAMWKFVTAQTPPSRVEIFFLGIMFCNFAAYAKELLELVAKSVRSKRTRRAALLKS